MADALCGPSNALQNFQKHSSADRTLQQDRLTSRHSPAQNFRSVPGQNAGALDSEFEAFQAGRAAPQPEFNSFRPHFGQPSPLNFAQPPHAPDWASDFQRLNITSSQASPFQRSQQPQTGNAAWHQDFIRQQSPAVQTPTIQQNTFGSVPSYSLGAFAGPNFQPYQSNMGITNNQMSDVAQGKLRAQETGPEFDQAAFERAFEQAERQMLGENGAHVHEAVSDLSRPAETDPVLLRIQEKRLPVYLAIKLRSELDLGLDTTAVSWLQDLENLEKNGKLTANVNEAKWCVDVLQKVAVRQETPGELARRAETLIKAINERLMSTYPLANSTVPTTHENIWNDLEAVGYTTGRSIREQAQQEPEQKQEDPAMNNDDEMARTAGKLLERVADNTSEKFQNSQFLELMRRLRDREVRVDGDKVVQVSSAQIQSSASPSQQPPAIPIPEPDPAILNHAHQDFGMVMDSQDESTGDIITPMPFTIITDDRIPIHEQDLDLGRSGVPGLDPPPMDFDPRAIREDENLYF